MLQLILLILVGVDASWTVRPSDTTAAGSINKGPGVTSFQAVPEQFDLLLTNDAVQHRFWNMGIPTQTVTMFGVGDVRISRFAPGVITDVIRFTRGGGKRVNLPAFKGQSFSEEDYHHNASLPLPTVSTFSATITPQVAGLSVSVVGTEGFFWYSIRGNSANQISNFNSPTGIPIPPIPQFTPWPVITLPLGVTSFKPTSLSQPGYLPNQGDINYDFTLPPNQCSMNNGGCDSSPIGTCQCGGQGCNVPMCGCNTPPAVPGFPNVPYMQGPWNGLQGSVCVGYQFVCQTNAQCHPTPQLYCSIITGAFGTCRINKCLETACPAGKMCRNAGDAAQCV